MMSFRIALTTHSSSETLWSSCTGGISAPPAASSASSSFASNSNRHTFQNHRHHTRIIVVRSALPTIAHQSELTNWTQSTGSRFIKISWVHDGALHTEWRVLSQIDEHLQCCFWEPHRPCSERGRPPLLFLYSAPRRFQQWIQITRQCMETFLKNLTNFLCENGIRSSGRSEWCLCKTVTSFFLVRSTGRQCLLR